jgi:nicotinate-nucleotide pyrophosphorylase
MIKDNHIIAAGGIDVAVERARARAPHTSRIEVEVTNLQELEEAIMAKADIVLLDNFDDELSGVYASRPTTDTPRRASSCASAAPCAPRPTIATS